MLYFTHDLQKRNYNAPDYNNNYIRNSQRNCEASNTAAFYLNASPLYSQIIRFPNEYQPNWHYDSSAPK